MPLLSLSPHPRLTDHRGPAVVTSANADHQSEDLLLSSNHTLTPKRETEITQKKLAGTTLHLSTTLLLANSEDSPSPGLLESPGVTQALALNRL